jgi:transposase, IS30 family
LLLHLGKDHSAPSVDKAMRRAIAALPGELFRTITWDQGKEMARHATFTVKTGIPSISAIPMHPGSGDPMRTPTACCASTCPREPTCRCTAHETWLASPALSTIAPGQLSDI